MTILDRVGQQQEHEDILGGKGRSLTYVFFEGQTNPAMFFADIVTEPGAYAGYHRHERHDTILYVLSGMAEHYQDGERCALKPGDAVLVKSGHAHAIKNIGDEDLRIIEFGAVPAEEGLPRSLGTRLPLPEELSDW